MGTKAIWGQGPAAGQEGRGAVVVWWLEVSLGKIPGFCEQLPRRLDKPQANRFVCLLHENHDSSAKEQGTTSKGSAGSWEVLLRAWAPQRPGAFRSEHFAYCICLWLPLVPSLLWVVHQAEKAETGSVLGSGESWCNRIALPSVSPKAAAFLTKCLWLRSVLVKYMRPPKYLGTCLNLNQCLAGGSGYTCLYRTPVSPWLFLIYEHQWPLLVNLEALFISSEFATSP